MLKKINNGLIIVMIVGTLYFAIYQYDGSRILTYLAVIPVLGAPLLLRKTKFQLSLQELCYYYVFVFMADFLGCVVNLYNMVWWFDIFIHFLSGIFTFMIGVFLLNKIKIGDDNFWFRMFFGICFVSLIALGWELFEFGADKLLGMDLQHNVDTGVHDTMIDMLVAFGGGVLSVVGYCMFHKRKCLVN